MILLATRGEVFFRGLCYESLQVEVLKIYNQLADACSWKVKETDFLSCSYILYINSILFQPIWISAMPAQEKQNQLKTLYKGRLPFSTHCNWKTHAFVGKLIKFQVLSMTFLTPCFSCMQSLSRLSISTCFTLWETETIIQQPKRHATFCYSYQCTRLLLTSLCSAWMVQKQLSNMYNKTALTILDQQLQSSAIMKPSRVSTAVLHPQGARCTAQQEKQESRCYHTNVLST